MEDVGRIVTMYASNEISRLLYERNWTPYELAKHVDGVKSSTIYALIDAKDDIENASCPGFETLDYVMRGFGFDITFLLPGIFEALLGHFKNEDYVDFYNQANDLLFEIQPQNHDMTIYMLQSIILKQAVDDQRAE